MFVTMYAAILMFATHFDILEKCSLYLRKITITRTRDHHNACSTFIQNWITITRITITRRVKNIGASNGYFSLNVSSDNWQTYSLLFIKTVLFFYLKIT